MKTWRFTIHRTLTIISTVVFLMGVIWCGWETKAAGNQAVTYDPALYQAMRWRLIGPFRGGRVTAVAGVARQPFTFYFGATGGGVWKTEDGGLSWRNVSDGYFKTGSIGAIAVADSDPNVIYVGTGESCPRGNVSHGDGVYKSTDGGRTWTNVGLRDSRHIARIRVHPENPDLVYVAALGHVFGPNTERGVFRSKDGGKTWEKVLFVDDKTGAVDLSMDATNPRILYAAFWQVLRQPWTLISGGPGSALYKTTDGGESWTKLTTGLPQGIKGRIGVAVSPVNPDRVWALVEAEDGGLYRSDDGGRRWRLLNKERKLRQRAWYYTHVYADPKDADTVYVLNTAFYKSIDGGRTFDITIRVPHGDNHDLWINPLNPLIMINSNDGGANVTFNGGQTWSPEDNQPTAQFYRVTTDNRFPYYVYGAQQDNTTVAIASRTTGAGIDRPDWYPVGGGESGHIAPDPRDPHIVYAGSYGGLITRYDHRTRQLRNITAWPQTMVGEAARDMKYRFQWNAPIVISPHDPKTLYHAAQVVLKTTDEGQTWQEISPDLTRNDKSKQDYSGGPITRDNTGVEVYGTIFALAESPRQAGVIWAGTDDGLVWVTRNGGRNWENVTPKELPEWGTVNAIEASPHDPATAYVAVHRYRLDDYRPYIFKTNDYGKTWTTITTGLPENDFVRVVREDPVRRGLLYAGTETGVYVSFTDGQSWQSLQLNLPVVPIHDLAIRDNDLIAATHGRSFWILDDLTPLHQMSDAVARADVYLFKPRTAYRMEGGSASLPNMGQNPPNGVVISYFLKEAPRSEVVLEVLDERGTVIQTFSSQAPAEAAPPGSVPEFAEFFGLGPQPTRLPAEAGMNRFVWNMRYPDPLRVPGAVLWGNIQGPKAVPGTYQVRLRVGGKTLTQSFEIKKNPLLTTTAEDFQKQFDLLIRIRDAFSRTSDAILRIRDVKKQVQDLSERTKTLPNSHRLAESTRALLTKLTAIEEELIQTKNESPQDPLNFPPKLNNQLATLYGVVASADARPTDSAVKRFEELTAQLDRHLSQLQQVLTRDLGDLNKLIRDQAIAPIIVPESKRPQ
jgi:photosystem II stability/assembly factor-like uncharacterized protein